MAPPSKRRLHLNTLKEKRFSTMPLKDETSSSSDESYIEFLNGDEPVNFKDKIKIEHIADLLELCANETSMKYLSVLLYMTLLHVGVSRKKRDSFLSSTGLFRAHTAHKWAEIFVNGDLETFQEENRGGRHNPTFFDHFPEIENEAKLYTLQRCSQKTADFNVSDLAKFIDKRYYEISNLRKIDDDSLIRSIPSCRLDLMRWGCRFKDNSQRPYFDGHERSDVVEHRQQFIDYFLNRRKKYYLVSNDDKPVWTTPTENPPCILLFHDESTFRSGEVCKKRWFFGDKTPFLSKGKGRSNMVSDFIVQHPSGPFFSLSQSEFKKALRKYPQLASITGVSYNERSATASINVGQQGYFDNATELEQFERLFQLLEFKEEFKNHTIECVVDNARTHSAKCHSLLDFGKGSGTRCPIDKIEYDDFNGEHRTLHCFFQDGSKKGLSEGLLCIGQELKIEMPRKIKLDDLRTLLSAHPAFQTVSRLEQLAERYGVMIKFCPKYHCELNPIEGLWCSQKTYIRKKTDQTFPTMLKLIVESRKYFQNQFIHLKLFLRFWKCLMAYKGGQSYVEVMRMFFSSKYKGNIISHTRI